MRSRSIRSGHRRVAAILLAALLAGLLCTASTAGSAPPPPQPGAFLVALLRVVLGATSPQLALTPATSAASATGAVGGAATTVPAAAGASGDSTTSPTTSTAPTAAPATSVPAPVATSPATTAPAAPPTTDPISPVARLPKGDLVYDGALQGGVRFEIFTSRPDGSHVRQLTDDPNYVSWWPRPSPDGTRILFYRSAPGVRPPEYWNSSLWIMNADGSGARPLFPAGHQGWLFQTHAEWSPDGSRIVVTAGKTKINLWTARPDGTDLREIDGGPGANVDPSFSPDGKWIVYIGCPANPCTFENHEVFKIPADGSGPRVQLTFDGLRDQDPVWSPDGSRIAFITLSRAAGPGVTENWDIRTVDASGANDARWVTTDDALESVPRWSPDGTRIWTHRYVFGSIWSWDLASMRPDGSDLRVLQAPQTQEFLAFVP